VAAAAWLCDDCGVATVVIVDDHPAFRASARRMLEQDGFDVVGEAGDGASGIALTRDLDPDVVLLDVNLPDVSGFEVAERLRPSRSEVLLTSSHDETDLGARINTVGARAFIPKERLSSAAVRAVLGGSL
jgi:DNA-binding NarL/FixJ family response regulator